MNEISGVLATIIENSRKANIAVAGDYVGADGLLYCGQCHTPKEYLLTGSVFGDNGLKAGCLCECAAERERKKALAEKETQQKEKIARLRETCFAGTRDRLSYATFANAINSPLLKKAEKYARHFDEILAEGSGLLLYGGVGKGKSFAAACIANYLLDKGIPVLFRNFAQIAAQMQANFEGRYEFLNTLSDYPLLIVDDFAAERDTEYMHEIIFGVIDGRYAAKKPIIITTNLTASGIKSAKEKDDFYKRVFGRVLETCTGIEADGENYREQLAKDNFERMRKLLDCT